MIPHNHITINDDTALWVFTDNGPVTDRSAVLDANRPCDTCDGDGLIWPVGSSFHDGPCNDCDGTGRHTFTVETPNRTGQVTQSADGILQVRVHVIDVQEIPDNAYLAHPKMPSAAEPGMFLIRLAVHT